jgi:hypothetical protein
LVAAELGLDERPCVRGQTLELQLQLAHQRGGAFD